MSNIKITEEVWHAEVSSAEAYMKTHDGELPHNAFWNMVENHYNNAIDTGNQARFDYWHCPTVVKILKETPSTPIVPSAPIYHIPVPICPVVPPASHDSPPVESSVAAPETISTAVPEPSSAWLIGGAIIFGWLGLNLAIWLSVIAGWVRESWRRTV